MTGQNDSALTATIRRLRNKLWDLAAEWRGAYDSEAVHEYQDVVRELLEIRDWDGCIGHDAIIPRDLLPPELLQRYDYWHCFPYQDKRKGFKKPSENPIIERLRENLHKIKARIGGQRADKIVTEYRSILDQLLAIESWDGRLELEALLPDEFLPKELAERFDYHKAIVEMYEQNRKLCG